MNAAAVDAYEEVFYVHGIDIVLLNHKTIQFSQIKLQN